MDLRSIKIQVLICNQVKMCRKILHSFSSSIQNKYLQADVYLCHMISTFDFLSLDLDPYLLSFPGYCWMSSGRLSFAKRRKAFIGRRPLGSPLDDVAEGAFGSLAFLDLALLLGTGPSTSFLLVGGGAGVWIWRFS
jgi:hypothetical protein